MPSLIFELADEHVRRYAELSPSSAAFWGVGAPEALSDWSAEAAGEIADLQRDTLRRLADLPVTGDADRLAALVMGERLRTDLERFEAGEHLRAVGVLFVPPFLDRVILSMTDDPELLSCRLASVPASVASWRRSLETGIARGIVSTRRLTAGMAAQLRTTAGDGDAGPSYPQRLADQAGNPALAGPVEQAYREAAAWLEAVYAPAASEVDAVGRERYVRELRGYLGADADPQDVFDWAWHELRRLEDGMRGLADSFAPGVPLHRVAEWLDEQPSSPAADGEPALLSWLQATMDDTIDALDGRVIDLAAPLRRLEAMIAPPGSAAAMYYSPPSEDLVRPGRTWYPVPPGQTRFPLWMQQTIAYHEGVPGHHLDRGTSTLLGRDGKLSRFQTLLGFYSGYSEGWAMYAERLMAELGAFTDPRFEFGHLAAQAFRATRIVVDAGVHCGLRLPTDSDVAPGQLLDTRTGMEFLLRHGYFPEPFLRSELDRYLGIPGQASCYKLGERAWLGTREAVRSFHGSVDLRRFHAGALALGSLPLENLTAEVLAAYSAG